MTINSAVSGISSSPAVFPLSEFCLRIFVLLCYSLTNEQEGLRLRHKRILFSSCIASELREKKRTIAWFFKKISGFFLDVLLNCIFFIFIALTKKITEHCS